MNYFAHAFEFLDRPGFVVGTILPDMLSVVDRRIRLRRKHLIPFFDDPDRLTADIARGAFQHFSDDELFHERPLFGQLSLELTLASREILPKDDGLRPRFLGHILVEIFLDDYLIGQYPERLSRFYQLIEKTDTRAVEDAFNRISPRGTDQLGAMIEAVGRARFLRDYSSDEKLYTRLNQIMRRVGLEQLPETIIKIFPDARTAVARDADAMMQGIPARLDWSILAERARRSA